MKQIIGASIRIIHMIKFRMPLCFSSSSALSEYANACVEQLYFFKYSCMMEYFN